jgi:hypothetical protein
MNATILKNDLESDISNRMENLTTIRTMSSRYSFSDNDIAAWTRCAFPIIYAEWEGFFVHAIEIYIGKINEIGLVLDDLHPNYLVRNTEKKFKQLKDYPDLPNKKYTFLNNLMTYFRNTNPISLETDVNTESNLGFKVLNNILKLLNLEEIKDHINDDDYSLQNETDRFLLNKRNGIAHGDPSSTITTDDITKAIKLVETLMNLTKDSIVKGYEIECFKNS